MPSAVGNQLDDSYVVSCCTVYCSLGASVQCQLQSEWLRNAVKTLAWQQDTVCALSLSSLAHTQPFSTALSVSIVTFLQPRFPVFRSCDCNQLEFHSNRILAVSRPVRVAYWILYGIVIVLLLLGITVLLQCALVRACAAVIIVTVTHIRLVINKI